MPRFLIHWATVAASLWVATEVVPGIRVRSFVVLAIAVVVLLIAASLLNGAIATARRRREEEETEAFS